MSRIVPFVVAAVAVTSAATAEGNVTFYGDVLPILQENCQVCHRANGANLGGMVAPMAFETYEDTRPWAKGIAKAVGAGQMPPWHAAPEFHGVFQNERTMTQEEIDTIIAWVDQGAPKGNPGDAPPAKEWPSADGWLIGEPDLVTMPTEPYWVADDVEDLYVDLHSTITEEMLPEERFIKAVEFRPGSSVVHHIIALPLGGIAPGNEPQVYPDGIAVPLKPGTDITWQMHYHKEPGPGTGMNDHSKAAIKLYPEDAQIDYIIKGNHLGRFDFEIPAGAENYSTVAEYTFKHDAKIVSFMPHMHVRGKSAKYEAFYPDGSAEVLLDVPQYDFNWQTSYDFASFKEVPAGTKIVFTSAWDNSANNPYNPDPTIDIRWGEPTTDEMSFGYMSFIDDSPERESMFGGRGDNDEDFDLVQVISMFDSDKDGMLQEDEAPGRMKNFFGLIDANKDGGISVEEAEQATARFNAARNDRATL